MHSYKSWVEISESALLHNLNTFKTLVGKDINLVCVVKANAYGHGLSEIVQILKEKVDWFGVDNIEEAIQIRSIDSKSQIIVLGYIPYGRLKDAVSIDTAFVVYNIETLKKIVSLKLKKTAKIHLKIETGLGRQGVYIEDIKKFTDFIKKYSTYLYLEGVSTHFANIEDTLDPSFALAQLKSFKNALESLKKEEILPPYIHSAATAGTL